jgi:hypothetical protein
MAANKATFPFLELSPELRCAIYEYATDWPHLTETFNQVQPFQALPELSETEIDSKRPPLCTFPKPHFNSTSTPSILLLNRKTSSEAHEVLYTKPFILSSPPPYIPQLAKPMDITEFVSENTLQNLRFVVLEMDLNYNPQFAGNAKCWLKTVETLLDVWCVRNRLERLEMRARYVPPDRSAGWTFGTAAHHRNVMGLISRVSPFVWNFDCADGG